MLGGCGALARYALDAVVSARAGGRFPAGTLAVNVSGSVLLGLLAGLALHGDALLLAGTALLGAFTTFSTWMFETHRLAEDGEGLAAALNVAGQPRARDPRRARPAGGSDDRRAEAHDVLRRARPRGRRFLSDALAAIYARHELQVSAVFRGAEGFGAKQRLQTARLLTLSEDLPLVSVAVDAPSGSRRALEDVVAVSGDGLITLERARLRHDGGAAAGARRSS